MLTSRGSESDLLEKTHNLPIDYDQRMTYFVEFAGCKKVVTGDIMWVEAENLVAQGFTTENMTDSESRIRDVDMAHEMMVYTKNNILTQAAQAIRP